MTLEVQRGIGKVPLWLPETNRVAGKMSQRESDIQ